jgi:hypothetical protein
MNETMKLNSQKTIDNDLDNVMVTLMMLGVTAVAAFICYLIVSNCKDACKDLYDARPLIFRRRSNAIHNNVSAPSSVARYPIPPHTQSDRGSSVAAALLPQ